MPTQNQATEETKRQLLASAGRILMKLNKDEGSEGFGVLGSAAGRLFSGGGVDPKNDVSEARIKYLQDKKPDLHKLISATNAPEDQLKQFLDESRDLERKEFYNNWDSSRNTAEGEDASQLISSIGISLKLEAENYRQRQQPHPPNPPIEVHVPVSSIQERGGADGAYEGLAGTLRGAEAGFGGGGGGGRLSMHYESNLNLVENYYELGITETGASGKRPARPVTHNGPDGVNTSQAGVAGGNPLPLRRGKFGDGPPPRRAGAGGGVGRVGIGFVGETAEPTMLLPGQVPDWEGPEPVSRVGADTTSPQLGARVGRVRGGGVGTAEPRRLEPEGAWGVGAGGVRGGAGGRGGGEAEGGGEAGAKREGDLVEVVEVVKKVLQGQVGNRFKAVAGAVRDGAGVADALLAGNKHEVHMRASDFGDKIGNGLVFAKSPSELREKADDRRVEQGISVVSTTTATGLLESTANRAGAFVDAALDVLDAVVDLATLDPKSAKEHAKDAERALVEGVIGGKSLEVRKDAAKERRQAEAAQAEERSRAEELHRAQAEAAQAEELHRAQAEQHRWQLSSISPRGDSFVTAELGFNDPDPNRLLRRESAIRDNTPHFLAEEDNLEVKIRKSGLGNYFRSWVPSCCSCCFCGLGPSEFEEYKPKRNSTYTYVSEEELFKKAKRIRLDDIDQNSHLKIDIDQDNKENTSTFISVSNNTNANNFLKELTFESIKEEKEVKRKNTLFKIIKLDQDAETAEVFVEDGPTPNPVVNRIEIGGCKIDRLNIVDLKSNTYKTKIYLDDAGIDTIKDFTERNKALFLQYFLNDPSLTAKSFLDSVPRDITAVVTFDPQNQDHQSALKKASEAVERLVERKMERGDFKFDLDDPNKEIAYVKILRKIDKSGNVKKDNKVEIKTGKEFSDSLKHINIHVGDSDYIQIHLENSKNGPKVQNNLNFYYKDSENKFDPIELKNSKHIKNSNIKIISHDNEETNFKAGNITEKKDSEEKKSSCFSCIRKAKPKLQIKESGVIRYDDGGWNIEFEKKDRSGNDSAKLIIDGNGRISFDEKDSKSRELADAFRKALGDKNEVRKFKLVRDNETYEVTIGGTQTGRTFRNTFGRGKTHGNGILKVEKISGNNLTQEGAVFDNSDDGVGRGRSWISRASCFGRGGRGDDGRQ